MTVEKPKQLLRQITTGTRSMMNQSHFQANTCNKFEVRKDHAYMVLVLTFVKPITKRSNCNHVFTFDIHLKTALMK